MNRQLRILAAILFQAVAVAPAVAAEKGMEADGAQSSDKISADDQARREEMNEDLASEIRDFQRGSVGVPINETVDDETLAMEENMYRQMALDSAPQCLDLHGRPLIDCVEDAIESSH